MYPRENINHKRKKLSPKLSRVANIDTKRGQKRSQEETKHVPYREYRPQEEETMTKGFKSSQYSHQERAENKSRAVK